MDALPGFAESVAGMSRHMLAFKGQAEGGSWLSARILSRFAWPIVIPAVFLALEAVGYASSLGFGDLVSLATPIIGAVLAWLVLNTSALKGPVVCCLAGILLGLAFAYGNFFFAKWAVTLWRGDGQSWGVVALFSVLIMPSAIVGAFAGFLSAIHRHSPAS